MESSPTFFTPKRLLRISELLKGLAHPVRLQLVSLLSRHEPLSVSDLLALLDNEVEQSLLSHHLIKMKEIGLLKSEKHGTNVYYSLKNRQVLALFDCMANCDLILDEPQNSKAPSVKTTKA